MLLSPHPHEAQLGQNGQESRRSDLQQLRPAARLCGRMEDGVSSCVDILSRSIVEPATSPPPTCQKEKPARQHDKAQWFGKCVRARVCVCVSLSLSLSFFLLGGLTRGVVHTCAARAMGTPFFLTYLLTYLLSLSLSSSRASFGHQHVCVCVCVSVCVCVLVCVCVCVCVC